MSRRILIVGGVAGGASAAARLRRLNENDEIVMFEKGPDVSFSNCSLPYHLSGIVEDADDLVLMKPECFKKKYNIDVHHQTEVLSIDRQNKSVTVKDFKSGVERVESYDKLILSPGAKPIIPPVPGINSIPTYSVRNVVDIDKLNRDIKARDKTRIAVIGGGFIGIEVAENLREAGHEVSLIEAMPQILMQFDEDMVQVLHKELYDHKINLIVNDKVVSFDEDGCLLQSGKKVHADMVVMAIGVTPEVNLAKNADIELGNLGAIKTNRNFQTSDPDIYAIGDAIEVFHALIHSYSKLPLAGPAQKQARAVADHINGRIVQNRGYIGSSVLKVFNLGAAATGLSERAAQSLQKDIEVIKVLPNDMVSLMPKSNLMHFKLIVEKPTQKILGAQAIGKGNIDKRIDVVATSIKFGATVDDLKDLELCYAPPFGTGKDVVNYAAYVASNVLHGDVQQIQVTQVRNLVKEGEYFLDVREQEEHTSGHIIGSHHFSMSSIRDRLDELPDKNTRIYVYCLSGQRSYNVARMLMQKGYKNVFNIAGGFKTLSNYEYFKDQTLVDRFPVVTNYCF